MRAANSSTLSCPTHGSNISHRSQICGRMREKTAPFCLKRAKTAKLVSWKLVICTKYYVTIISLLIFFGWFGIYTWPQERLYGFETHRNKSYHFPKMLGPKVKNTHFSNCADFKSLSYGPKLFLKSQIWNLGSPRCWFEVTKSRKPYFKNQFLSQTGKLAFTPFPVCPRTQFCSGLNVAAAIVVKIWFSQSVLGHRAKVITKLLI